MKTPLKTPLLLLIGAIIGIAVGVAVAQTAANTPATPPASAAAPTGGGRGAGGGGASVVHPVSKNITERLTNSPRHFDIVKIKQGDREIESYVFFPKSAGKSGAVVLIHEIFGLSDWMRAAADQMAEAGYIVVVPDLLSGMGPNKGGTNDFADTQVTAGVQRLAADQVTADLNAVIDYAKKIDTCNGNVAIAGFCWGGGKAFTQATANKDLKAIFVFYGAVPPVADMAKISAPVYGFFPELDSRTAMAGMNAAGPMKDAGKTYEPIVYAGAQHGFMRTGQMDNTNDADKKAAADSWKRMLDVLAKINAPDTKAAPASAPPKA